MNCQTRRPAVDLGLAVLSAMMKPGEHVTYDTIAAATGLTRGGVMHIERNALRKLRMTARHLVRETCN
jgi:DNA-directed RNA polymerase sigma subunit (sigma70/sigma32)